MRKIWPFSLLNDEQMSNKVGVKHQPVFFFPEDSAFPDARQWDWNIYLHLSEIPRCSMFKLLVKVFLVPPQHGPNKNLQV